MRFNEFYLNEDSLSDNTEFKKFVDMGVDFFVSEGKENIHLSSIKIPKELRGQGIGTSFMEVLTNYADKVQKVITLSPSTDFGASSVSRLKNFYKRFGFVENKGRNKDFTISDTMYREPIKEN